MVSGVQSLYYEADAPISFVFVRLAVNYSVPALARIMTQSSGDLNSLNLLSLSLDERVNPGSSPLTRDYIYKVKDLLNRPSGHFPHSTPNP